MSGDIEVKDRRRSPWFWIDNHVLDKYAKKLGPTPWAIYTTICRLANEQVLDDGTRRRKRRISVNGLASIWGIDPRTVRRATRVLRKEQLIRVTKKQGVSEVELLSVEQLNFDDKLTFGQDTSVPSQTRSDRTPKSSPTGHQSPFREDRDVLHSKPSLSKPSSSKPSGVDAGFKPAAVSTKIESSKASPLSGADVRLWLAIKVKLKSKISLEEWNLWVRPAKLLHVMPGRVFLIALPPGGKVLATARERKQLLNNVATESGAGGAVQTVYPDEWTVGELKKRGGWDLEWILERREEKRRKKA
jgi:hypothetical protein